MKIVFFLGKSWEKWSPVDVLERGIGGSETAAYRMASALVQRGHEVRLYGTFKTEETVEGAQYIDIERLNVESPVECDVLVVSRFIDGSEATKEVIKPKVKVLWNHDVPSWEDPKSMLTFYDALLCLTEWHRDEYIKHYNHVDPKKVLVTRNGIEPSLFAAEPVKEGQRLAFCSSPDRGLDVLLEVWPQIRERVSDAELHIYYGFENWEIMATTRKNHFELAKINYYKALIATSDNVVFHGRVGQRELASELLKTKVWGYPTDFPESYCISAIEAQAAGAVPVCTGLSALGEVIKFGVKLPEMFLPHSKEKFVNAVCRMLEDDEHRQSYAEPGRRYALENLSWSGVASQWEGIFEGLLAGIPLALKTLPGFEMPKPEEQMIESLIVVLTCKRPVSYVEATLQEIMAQGGTLASKRVLLFDGPIDTSGLPAELLADWTIMEIPGKDASSMNGEGLSDKGLNGTHIGLWSAVSLGDTLGAGKVLFMEDDILPCKNAIERALSFEVPDDLGLVTFFDPGNVPPGEERKLWKFGARKYSCNQCFLMPRRSARWIRLSDPTNGPWHGSNGDDFIGRSIARSPWPKIGTHIPCLVEHIGEVSLGYLGVGLIKGRVATNFPGKDFDALSLGWR
jgi:glycosyltransferase involved in cell wall biosynthesis